MKKLLFFMSLAIFALTSCTSDENLVENKLSTNSFQPDDINSLKILKTSTESFHSLNQPKIVSAIKKSRANSEYTQEFSKEQIDSLIIDLETLGDETIKTFESLGITKEELNAICSLNNKSLYGIAAIELMDALDPTDLIKEPQADGCEIVIKLKFDSTKALKCLSKTLGMDIWEIIHLTGFSLSGGYMTKKAMYSIIKSTIKKVGEKLALSALSGGYGAALLVAEWACCYFDVPILSNNIMNTNNYNKALFPYYEYAFLH